MKKFELTNETIEYLGRTLHRIRALRDFSNVKAGDLGGYIESAENLAQDGLCWVYGDARVYDNAWVCNDAKVYGDARICNDAKVYGARVCCDEDYACVRGFGRAQRTTTFYRTSDGAIGVTCGCFAGTLDEFRAKVRETHGNSKYAKEYLMIADLMEMHFGEKR